MEISGGSAANTMVGVVSFGGSAAFVGRVRDDQLGAVFGHDIRAAGVEFHGQAPAGGGAPTGRCLIVVTPDAQRTLNTFLGASAQLGPDDLDHELIARAQVLYLEGYLWDEPDGQGRVPAGGAHRPRRRQPGGVHAVGRLLRRASPRRSSSSWSSTTSTCCSPTRSRSPRCTRSTRFDDALQRVQHHCEIAALTRSEKGAVIVARDEMHVVDAHPVDEVVDTTGAGDLFAAGFLYGLTHGYDLGTAAASARCAAAEVISHLGARPEQSLAACAAPLLARVT